MSHEVRDLVRHLPPELKRKLKEVFRSLARNPYAAKPLKEELEGLASAPVGRMRIILRMRGKTLEIVAVGHRRDIYERVAVEMSRALRRPRSPRD
jgi:mRNA-degrading endonuclease RelE of RelBE toxin-antitoxin system